MKPYLLVLALFLLSCAATQSELFRAQYPLRYLPADSTYFPYGIFIPQEDSFLVCWYTRQLVDFQEPRLYNTHPAKEIYRLIYLPAFTPPVTVRLEIENDIATIHSKKSDVPSGHMNGKLVVDERKQLSPELWKPFVEALHEKPFWNQAIDPHNKMVCLDCTEWILEGIQNGTYHTAKLSSPSADNPFRLICEELIKMSGLQVDTKDKSEVEP